MTIDTYTNLSGETCVRIQGGCTDKIIIRFSNRTDALALLKALRRRLQ